MADPPPCPGTGDDTGVRPDGSTTNAPRWVKVSGIVVIVLVLLIGSLMLLGGGFGGHGPGRHTPPSSGTELGVPQP